MASLADTFQDVRDLGKLAEEASNNNYDGSIEFGEQAERLAQIEELAGRAAKAFAAANKALGG